MNEFNQELVAEFAEMDTNKNNLISEPEMEAYVLQQDYDSRDDYFYYNLNIRSVTFWCTYKI